MTQELNGRTKRKIEECLRFNNLKYESTNNESLLIKDISSVEIEHLILSPISLYIQYTELYNLGLAYKDSEGKMRFNESVALLIIYDELVDDAVFISLVFKDIHERYHSANRYLINIEVYLSEEKYNIPKNRSVMPMWFVLSTISCSLSIFMLYMLNNFYITAENIIQMLASGLLAFMIPIKLLDIILRSDNKDIYSINWNRNLIKNNEKKRSNIIKYALLSLIVFVFSCVVIASQKDILQDKLDAEIKEIKEGTISLDWRYKNEGTRLKATKTFQFNPDNDLLTCNKFSSNNANQLNEYECFFYININKK
jgi:hypothetical protein